MPNIIYQNVVCLQQQKVFSVIEAKGGISSLKFTRFCLKLKKGGYNTDLAW